MASTFHLGYEVPDHCKCLNVGADGTNNHSGNLTLIEISQGFSRGRRTRSCANHLNSYLSPYKKWHRHTWQEREFPSDWVIVIPADPEP